MRKRLMRLGMALYLAVGFANGAWAQAGQGTIQGTITDASGGTLPGVTVTATNVNTNVKTMVVTSDAGVYLVSALTPGKYVVSFVMPSFSPERREIDVRAGERLRVDLSLSVGGRSEDIKVVAETPLLQTTTASRGTVIDASVVENLPLGTRNPYTNLVMLSPGVVGETTNLQSLCCRPFDNGGMDNIAINGGVSRSNAFALNGATNTVREGNANGSLGFVPSPDAVQEVRIDTSSVDASQGRTGGGTISVSVKSGTNVLRFSNSLNYRPKAFNQNILTNRLTGGAKPNIHLYDDAVTLGGPVVIPRLYNGKDRTFFFGSYEYWHSSEAAASNARVPTALERAGNFSQSINGVAGANIFDPFTVVNGARQPFAGNIIPAERLNPLALAYLSYYPEPTRDVDVNNQNYTFPGNSRGDRYYSTLFRLDHNIGNSRVMASYGHNSRKEIRADNGIVFEATGTSRHFRINNVLNLEMTTPLGDTRVQRIAGGWTNHFRHDDAGGELTGFDSASLGYPTSLTGALPPRFYPVSNGVIGLGGSAGLQQKSNDFYLQYELTHLKGRQSFKYGAEYRVLRDYGRSSLGGIAVNAFTFNRNFTSNSTVDAPATSAGGNAFASFLLGTPAFSTTNASAGGSLNRTPLNRYNAGYFAAYVQDDIRLSKQLTVNLGLRWDYDPIPYERDYQTIKGFDATVANPFVCVPCAAIANNITTIGGVTYANPALAAPKGGMLFADGEPGFKRDLNNFGPRAGVTYQLNAKMVVRGAYGLTYSPRATDGRQTGGVFSKATPLVTSTDNGLTPIGTYRNTVWNNAYAEGILPIDGASKGLLASIGNGFSFESPDRRNPMFHSYSTGLQIQLPLRSVLDVSFVGSRTNEIGINLAVNDVPLELVRQLNVPDPNAPTQTLLNRTLPNPYRGLVPDNPTLNRATTISLQNLLRPFPQYAGAITSANNPLGFQRYKAFQVSWEKRLSHGLSGLVAYTGSRTTESTGPLNQGEGLIEQLTSQHRPHVLKLTAAWSAPTFETRNRLLRWTIGGWNVSTITTVRSGPTVGMPGGVDVIGDYVLANPTFGRAFNTCTLTVAGLRQNCADSGTADATRVGDVTREPLSPAFQVRAVGAPVTTTSRLEGALANEPFYFDFSFGKMVRLSRRGSVRIQLDLYNAGGANQYGNPNTTVNDANGNFGRVAITSQTNDPRKAQLTLRFNY